MLLVYCIGFVSLLFNLVLLYNIKNSEKEIPTRVLTRKQAMALLLISLIPIVGCIINLCYSIGIMIAISFIENIEFMPRKDGKERKFWIWLNKEI